MTPPTKIAFPLKGRGYSAPRRIPRTFRAVNIVIIRCEPTFRRPAIGRSNGILLFIQHRSFCPATATVGAKSLVLLPVTVLEIEAQFRASTLRDALPPGPSPSSPLVSRAPPHTTLVSPLRADGSTAPHGLNPHCFSVPGSACATAGAHGDALAQDVQHALPSVLTRARIGRNNEL